MGLRTDTVDGDAIGNEALDERYKRIDLGTSVVEVVVVDKELCGGVGLFGGAEGKVDEFGTEDVVED